MAAVLTLLARFLPADRGGARQRRAVGHRPFAPGAGVGAGHLVAVPDLLDALHGLAAARRRGPRSASPRRTHALQNLVPALVIAFEADRRSPLRCGARSAHMMVMTTRTLPVLPLRDIVVFPHRIVPLFVGREKSVAALEAAMAERQGILPRRPARPERGRSRPRRALRPRRRRHRDAVAEAARRHRPRAGRRRPARAAGRSGRRRRASWPPRSSWSTRTSADGAEVAGADALGDRAVRQLRQAQQAAAGRDRDPARRDRGCRRCSPTRSPSNLSIKVADKQALLGELNPVAPARNGVRLHGRRAWRAPGREEDPQPGQAPDGEDPARILSQRAVEGDPARARQRGRGRRRRARRARPEDPQDPAVEGSARQAPPPSSRS